MDWLVKELRERAKIELDEASDAKWWLFQPEPPVIEEMLSWKAAERIEKLTPSPSQP